MRVRVTYARLDSMRFTGHLDLQKVWERSLRRSRLPVSYSQGFNPQARLQIASALPLGFTSRCEILDFWLDSEVDPAHLRTLLVKAVPPGIAILDVIEVDSHSPALQTQVISNRYKITLLDKFQPSDLEFRIKELLDRPEIVRSRRERTYDLRPLIESLELSNSDKSFQILIQLSARPGATGRPEEVISSLGLDPLAALYERTELILA
jgi:radical SAM-linked protein